MGAIQRAKGIQPKQEGEGEGVARENKQNFHLIVIRPILPPAQKRNPICAVSPQTAPQDFIVVPFLLLCAKKGALMQKSFPREKKFGEYFRLHFGEEAFPVCVYASFVFLAH